MQKLLVLPILFLIYISRVFKIIIEINPIVTLLSFVDDLGFIFFETPVKEIAQTLEMVVTIVLESIAINIVIYDIFKIEVVLFFKSYC